VDVARLTKSSTPLGIGAPRGRAGCGEAWGLAARSLPPPVTLALDAFSRQHGVDPARLLAGAWAVVLSPDA
jgi:hypothetical protein